MGGVNPPITRTAMVPWQRHGMAWHGVAWHGMTWQSMACHGMARHGMTWPGKARHGMARQTCEASVARRDMTWRGIARHGMAWHGTPGMAGTAGKHFPTIHPRMERGENTA